MIGIMTYHGARNYGAVIQAYALQQFINLCDEECRIIDFVPNALKDYTSLYPKRNGLKSIIKNMLMLKYHSLRKIRNEKFEHFVNNQLVMTDEHYENEEDLWKLNLYFDTFVVGSDQVWNTLKSEFSKAYFLDFVDRKRRKIAYSVSLGNATLNDIKPFDKNILEFDYITCREARGVDVISNIIGEGVKLSLDPTLLVDNTVLDYLITDSSPLYKNYIFYYSLDGFNKRKNNVNELIELSNKFKKKVVVLAPEWPKQVHGFVNAIDAGPIEFLNLIKNAYLVCTNSFHGTALSISFRKNFYVLEQYDGKDDRKISLLKQLGLENRMVKDIEIIKQLDNISINYDNVNKKLTNLQCQSRKYFMEALKM